ncbi:MAG: J domain-containing protein [Chloroflexi bacterium]|nr:J domain-containing protein [Chloroflexota bacterium]
MADRGARQPGEEKQRANPSTGRGASSSDGAPDYYALLGVDPDAPQETIAVAYRRQAARYAGRAGSGAAARHFKLLNAAYTVVGNPARRVDYDRQRAALPASPAAASGLPGRRSGPRQVRPPNSSPSSGMGGKPLERLALATIAAVGLATGALIVGLGGVFDIGTPLADVARQVGLISRTRPTPGLAIASDTPEPTLLVAASAATLEPTPASLEAQFEHTTVRVEPPEPRPGSEVAVTATVARNGKPMPNLPLHLVAHYRTVDERWPAGEAAVQTDERGAGKISFNVGNATRGYTVKVDVVASVDGQEVVWHGEFTPR